MRRLATFIAVLLVGLAVLSLVGYLVLATVVRDWFDSDTRLRARLAVTSASRSLRRNWTSDTERLAGTLADITRDERIMGAAACSTEGASLAATDGFPAEFSCASVPEHAFGSRAVDGTSFWDTHAELPAGPVHLTVSALTSGDELLGYIVLVHDLSFIDRRKATTRALFSGAFFVLSLGASLVTLLASRIAWRSWTLGLRRALSGEPSRQFQPLLRDVRRLAVELAEERDREARAGPWSPERLRATLRQHLHDERVVVLANREPYIHEHDGETIRVVHPASGLVTALEPVMRACSGTWVAHGAGDADRETADDRGHIKVPPKEESYLLRRVWLTEEEERGYYYGFSNEGLWPLCHLAHARPVFRSEDWEQYVVVNQRFAEAVCEEVDSDDDPIVLVQDYHFALAPRMIRERLPQATILSFWHIPWPNAERLGICPWREELLSGLLGSSIIGFHTQQHCNSFVDSVDAFLESRIDRETQAIVQGGRRTLVRPYPISIEWPVRWLTGMPSVPECRESVRRDLGIPQGTLLGVGIDRLDYTKGIEERLQAVDTLFVRHPELRGRFVFAQLAAPSRTKIERYQELNDRVVALAESINARWADGDWRPIVLLRAHHEPATVFRYYRAADVCYVSSLHDGMNLVTKEFVAARDDEQGVLVLSQFTGAARELTEALVVNPYDLRQVAEALATALTMPQSEQRERMRSMRRLVSELNVYRWAGRMLVDASELRRRERLSGRLAHLGSSVALDG